MLSDILPTGFECGVLNGKVQPGSTAAIVGAGPIGLASLLTAQFYSPAQIVMIDRDANRLDIAHTFGAPACIDIGQADAVPEIMKLSDGAGVDCAIEAVGVPATLELCQSIVQPHSTRYTAQGDLHLEALWDRNITITTRLVIRSAHRCCSRPCARAGSIPTS